MEKGTTNRHRCTRMKTHPSHPYILFLLIRVYSPLRPYGRPPYGARRGVARPVFRGSRRKPFRVLIPTDSPADSPPEGGAPSGGAHAGTSGAAPLGPDAGVAAPHR